MAKMNVDTNSQSAVKSGKFPKICLWTMSQEMFQKEYPHKTIRTRD